MAPHVKVTGSCHSTWVQLACCYFFDFLCNIDHFLRLMIVLRCVVTNAKLTTNIESPCVNFAGCGQSKRMLKAASNILDNNIQTNNLGRWRTRALFVTLLRTTKLASFVTTPTHNFSLLIDSHTMKLTTSNFGKTVPAHFNWTIDIFILNMI